MRPRMNDLDPAEKDFVSQVKLPACPELAMLHAAREGVLPETQAKQVETHLAGCEVCRTLFQDLDAIEYGAPSPAESASIRARIARSAPRAFQPEQHSGIGKRWWAPALAFAACAAIGVVLLKPAKTEAPAPAQRIAQAKAMPEITVEKLPIRVDASALLATRGAGNRSTPSGPELAKALAKYQNDDYPAAVQQLKGLSEKYPKDGTVRLYLGVSELLLNQNDAAASDLNAAIGELEGGRISDAQWYLAATQLRLKNTGAAAPLLQELCEGKSPYQEQSCKLESQLK